MRTALIFTALLTLAALPIFAQGPQAMDRDSWSGPIAPGSAIRVENHFGDVRLRHGGSDGNLEVAAILQQLSIDGSKLVLSVEITDKAAVVSVVRYDSEGNPAPLSRETTRRAPTSRSWFRRGFPPVSKPTAVSSRPATSEPTSTSTPRPAPSGSPSTTDGSPPTPRSARSRSPSCPRRQESPRSSHRTTGPITVFTPATNDLDVAMETSGAFITDFSLKVEHHDTEEPNKTATASIGSGGPTLKMTSKRGDLALRRLVTADTD